jgi:hypothetical protein
MLIWLSLLKIWLKNRRINKNTKSDSLKGGVPLLSRADVYNEFKWLQNFQSNIRTFISKFKH